MAESRREQKHRRIVEEAERIFLSFGLRSASIDEIAAAAGVSKVTIYNYFGSKDDLFVECVRRLTERHFDELNASIEQVAGAAAKLNAVFAHNIEASSRYQPAFIKDMMGVPRIWERVRVFRESEAERLITGILEEGVATGEFRQIDIRRTTRLIMSFAEIVPRLYPYEDEREAEHFLRNLYEFLTGAVSRRT